MVPAWVVRIAALDTLDIIPVLVKVETGDDEADKVGDNNKDDDKVEVDKFWTWKKWSFIVDWFRPKKTTVVAHLGQSCSTWAKAEIKK